ncbi:GNAT family N-acetyltransferase [Citricoccus sp.]|uniref:GNAT family N-acetyltransferase n=1 Tax=Citricoccus sp. TaxID=1978372 RepID=UPI0028BE7D0A|nr:GNAT family N-acetyltransferase [Citricoccus sp.]
MTLLGWPAIESQEVDGWSVRFSSGITRRANSVVSATMPASMAQIETAVDEVERRSAERWLAPTFQQWLPASGSWLEGYAEKPGARSSERSSEGPSAGDTAAAPHVASEAFFEGQQRLGGLLERRGYEAVAPTDVLWMDREGLPEHAEWDRRILVNETLSDEWLDAYVGRDAVGGPSGDDSASRMVHRRLLGGGRSRFYSYLDEDGIIAGGAKVSLVTPEGSATTYAGIYALWVREDRRGRGLSALLLDAIFNHLVRLDVSGCWLQVEERSTRARAVYQAAGFSTVARYRYLTRAH